MLGRHSGGDDDDALSQSDTDAESKVEMEKELGVQIILLRFGGCFRALGSMQRKADCNAIQVHRWSLITQTTEVITIPGKMPLGVL